MLRHTSNLSQDGSRRLRNRHPAFTLVELLVVITIIAILVGLLIPAAMRARVVARQTAIKTEISNLATAIESYKNDVAGGAYPPDAMVGGTTSEPTPPVVRNKIASDFKRHFKKAFPRHREPDELIEALVGARPGGNQTTPNNPNLPGGMTPGEAMVFWLQRFSSDPKYPISGSGGPAFFISGPNAAPEDLAARNWIIDFAPDRFQPRGDDNFFAGRLLQYADPRGSGETLQINFWQYVPASSEQPIAYFDASRGIHDIEHPELESAGIELHPLKQLKAGSTTQTLADIRLVNEGKFQILHCGNDGEWGDFGAVHIELDATPTDNVSILLYPEGPFTLDLADTVTNFGDHHSLSDAN